MPDLPVLHVIPFSHFNEKAMWVLDLKGIPYQLQPLADPTDRAPILRVTGGRSATTPVLVAGDQVLHDSSDIAAWAEAQRPEPRLIPEEPALRRECLLLEDWADEVLGPHSRRWLFGQLLFTDPARGKAFFLATKPAWQRPLLWPFVRRLVGRAMQITPGTVRASAHTLRGALGLLAERLDGREFLLGDRLTLADLTVASLLSPLTMAGTWTREQPGWARLFAWREALREAHGRRASLLDPIPEADERARRGAQARARLGVASA